MAQLNTVFSSQIRQKSITLEEVRTTVEKQPLLQHIDPIKIRDKIRSYFKTDDSESDMEDAPSPPTETESRDERLKRFGIESSNLDAGMILFLLKMVSANKYLCNVHTGKPH